MCPTPMQNHEAPKWVFCCWLAWWAFLHRRGAIFCVLEGLKNWGQNREHEEKFDPSQSKRLVLGVSERVLNPGLQEKLYPSHAKRLFLRSAESWKLMHKQWVQSKSVPLSCKMACFLGVAGVGNLRNPPQAWNVNVSKGSLIKKGIFLNPSRNSNFGPRRGQKPQKSFPGLKCERF